MTTVAMDPRIERLFDAMTKEADLALEAKADALAAVKGQRLDDAARLMAEAAVHQRVAQILLATLQST